MGRAAERGIHYEIMANPALMWLIESERQLAHGSHNRAPQKRRVNDRL